MKRSVFLALSVFLSAFVALAALSLALRAPPIEAQAKDAILPHTLRVEIDGIAQTTFRSVEGLEIETEVTEFRDGAEPNVTRKLPGRTAYKNIVLKFDPSPLGHSLWTWYSDLLNGNVSRRSMKITLLNQDGKPVVSYNLTRAWPAKWVGPRQISSSSAVPLEEVTIACEHIDRTH